MKKIFCSFLCLSLLLTLMSCDRSHLCSLDLHCSNENASIIVSGEECDSYSFSSKEFNSQPLENYSNIDFTDSGGNTSNAKVYRFEIASLTDTTYNLSLSLIDANRYVVDFLRVGVVVNNEVVVYKYNDLLENIYHKENDPDSILHFNSKNDIFSELSINIGAGESKEIAVYVWIEEAELYNGEGERRKGWADKSYYASPITLNMEIK